MNDQGITQQQAETDLYAVLGVTKDATGKEIHRAYKKLAKKFHPDVNPDADSERFKEISAAYDILGDEQKRSEYDEFRSMLDAGFPGGFGAASGGFHSSAAYNSSAGFQGAGGYQGADINDLLGQMFASRPSRRHVRVQVDFYDAARGTDMQLQLTDGTATTVRIPQGTDTGDQLLVRTDEGDLIVEVIVSPHSQFQREGLNLRLDVPVSITEAALGGKIKVPTFDGKPVSLKVPAGTPHGRTMRVRERGLTDGRTTGDLLVSISVSVPTELTKEQRDLLAQFAEIEPKIDDKNRI